MMLPGTASIPATDSRRLQAATATGRRIVQLVQENLRPSRILTPAAFDNAIRTLLALGGSTNAVVHLIALAGRRGIRLPLSRFDELARTTPFLVNLMPSGRHLMDAFDAAGGVPAVMAEIRHLLELDAMTVNGHAIGDNIRRSRSFNRDVIAASDKPLSAGGSLAVLTGNLAPSGAIIKVAAASAELMERTGRAIVFHNYEDMLARVNSPDLPVSADSVLVLQNAGPKGVPGFPEWGSIPIPTKLLQAGVTDVIRISDSRMSGTAFGTVVLHIAPEAAAGGPLALIQDGDLIELNVPGRRLELLVDDAELDAEDRVGNHHHRLTCEAIRDCTSTMSCRPTKAVTSISCDPQRLRHLNLFSQLWVVLNSTVYEESTMDIVRIFIVTICLSCSCFLVADDDITFERVIGPEFPGKYKHPATIAEFQNGDLYIAYYSGTGEYEQDTRCYGTRLAKGSREWSTPQIIADTPDRSDGNVAVWQAPDGIVWMFYVVNYGPT